eukprot:COSAG06_NODE_3354_length_5468_cov_10.052710_2_plen_116_part_00
MHCRGELHRLPDPAQGEQLATRSEKLPIKTSRSSTGAGATSSRSLRRDFMLLGSQSPSDLNGVYVFFCDAGQSALFNRVVAPFLRRQGHEAAAAVGNHSIRSFHSTTHTRKSELL